MIKLTTKEDDSFENQTGSDTTIYTQEVRAVLKVLAGMKTRQAMSVISHVINHVKLYSEVKEAPEADSQ